MVLMMMFNFQLSIVYSTIGKLDASAFDSKAQTGLLYLIQKIRRPFGFPIFAFKLRHFYQTLMVALKCCIGWLGENVSTLRNKDRKLILMSECFKSQAHYLVFRIFLSGFIGKENGSLAPSSPCGWVVNIEIIPYWNKNPMICPTAGRISELLLKKMSLTNKWVWLMNNLYSISVV